MPTTQFAPTTLAELTARLEDRRRSASRMVSICGADATTALQDVDISDLLDSDTPDGGTNDIDRARALALAAAARRTTEAADAAMARLVSGHYGTCTACHGRIPLARLRALPETTVCVECKRAEGHLLATAG